MNNGTFFKVDWTPTTLGKTMLWIIGCICLLTPLVGAGLFILMAAGVITIIFWK